MKPPGVLARTGAETGEVARRRYGFSRSLHIAFEGGFGLKEAAL
jgi:hypothetical protein